MGPISPISQGFLTSNNNQIVGFPGLDSIQKSTLAYKNDSPSLQNACLDASLVSPLLNKSWTPHFLRHLNPPITSLSMSSALPNSTQTITNLIFGLTATIISVVTVWQGHRVWKMWREHHAPDQESVAPGIDPCIHSHQSAFHLQLSTRHRAWYPVRPIYAYELRDSRA